METEMDLKGSLTSINAAENPSKSSPLNFRQLSAVQLISAQAP